MKDLIGYVDYDDFDQSGQSRRSTDCVIVCQSARPSRGTYIRIAKAEDTDCFVGRIIDGPFSTRRPGAYYIVELTAMMTEGQKGAVRNRPDPATPVSILAPSDVQAYIGTTGDFRLGCLVGQRKVEVALDSSTLNRHIGIFGTTGSGKSNTLQVVAEEINHSNRSVLIFDIEGEYVGMNEPTDSLQSLLSEFGKKPTGVSDFHVFVPRAEQ